MSTQSKTQEGGISLLQSKHSRAQEITGKITDKPERAAEWSSGSEALILGSEVPKSNPEVDAMIARGDYSHPSIQCIPESELRRMKNDMIILSKQEQLEISKALDDQREQSLAAAKAKRDRMLAIDQTRKLEKAPNEADAEYKAIRETLLSKAKQASLAEHDDVKDMNRMVKYAKVATIRDRQIAQKRQIEDEFKNLEKRKDLMIEIERLKELDRLETEQRRKEIEFREGARQIITQIKERDLLRLKEREELEQEGQRIVQEIKENERLEREEAIRKKEEQRREREAIAAANKNAGLILLKRKQDELDEDQKIVQYNKEREQKEIERLAEEKRIRDEKEREVQRLREQQERQSDRQAELDLLRAKRAWEANERQAREKELREAQQRKRMNDELNEARQQQLYEKDLRRLEQAKHDQLEFKGIIQTQKIEQEIEIETERERQKRIQEHGLELRKQIALRDEARRQGQAGKWEEGKAIRDALLQRRAELEAIKKAKLQELHSVEIPEKYTVELAMKKLNP